MGVNWKYLNMPGDINSFWKYYITKFQVIPNNRLQTEIAFRNLCDHAFKALRILIEFGFLNRYKLIIVIEYDIKIVRPLFY